jgi:hypothetical protein
LPAAIQPKERNLMRNNRTLLLKLSLLVAFLLGACNLPLTATKTPVIRYITATPRPTATAEPIPSDTTVPLQLPTEALPTDALPPEPTSTPTILFTVAVTFSPTPPDAPGVTVRIRNMTGGPVNLFRHVRSGEIHFLGWLEHGFYGIFQFPDLGEWMIRYCKRDKQGDSFSCEDKLITVKQDDQEFKVP